jgi:hypothetical protein
MRSANIIAAACVSVIAAACYIHPIPNDFDRYMYEAIVRSKFQSLEVYYPVIRHASARAEESSVIDTPTHMKGAEPLYAIRPLYTDLIFWLSLTGLSIQQSINLISALSLFCTGVLILLWTDSPILSVLLVGSWQVLELGRTGTPDGLSAFVTILALFILDREQIWALLLLFLGLFIRTDSLLILLAILAWQAVSHRLRLWIALGAGLGAVITVMGINHWAHHPGWLVLFRISFIGGRATSNAIHALSIREYAVAFARGAWSLFGQMSLWGVLAIVTWRMTRSSLLIVATAAAVLHFILFPSPELRYLLWYCLLIGTLFIQAIRSSHAIQPLSDDPSVHFWDAA